MGKVLPELEPHHGAINGLPDTMKKIHATCENKYELNDICKVRVRFKANNTYIETTNRGKQYDFI